MTRGRLLALAGVAVLAAVIFAAVRTAQAGFDARAGRDDLQRAAVALREQHTVQALHDFSAARRQFQNAHDALHGMGPLLPIGHVIPLVRVQLRGLETMSDVGKLLADAGAHLTDVAQRLLAAKEANRPLAQAMPQLQAVEAASHQAVLALTEARRRTAELDGYRLLGPLGSTRTRLEHELAATEPNAVRADAGLQLVLWLAGAKAPHRTLVFSQNPDEVRPTGGFLGTYGVLTGDAGRISLARYGDTIQWVAAHPQVGIKSTDAPSAFQFASPPQMQTLANVNASPDWPHDAALAATQWKEAGERPVEAVFSLMPQTLARILKVLGPVSLPSYGETITAQNLVARLNFHTHREAVRLDPNRKQFIVDLSQVVIHQLLLATSSKWLPLGGALADSFGAGEALMWSSDPHIEALLRSMGWAGQFPSAPGDFYDESEFEYIAKNGHELQRTFDHVVTLKPDGSGASATTMVLADTGAPEPGYNDDSLSYITPYGPKFCSQDPTSDKPDSGEQPLAGHPTAGYLRAAQPHGSMSLRVAFQCPALALPRTDGSFLYSLDFRDQPGHSGDILHLSVHLPQGFTWAGQPPPSTVRLYGEFRGAWEFHHSA